MLVSGWLPKKPNHRLEIGKDIPTLVTRLFFIALLKEGNHGKNYWN